MIAPVSPQPPWVTAPGATGTAKASGSASGQGQTGFGQVLSQAMSGLNNLQTSADQAATALAHGNSADLATAVVAAEKANLGLQLAVEVRNRALAAYQQIMQLQM